MTDNLTTLSSLATVLDLTPSAVTQWSKQPGFPAPVVEAGRTRLFDPTDVVKWGIDAGRIKSPSDHRVLADVVESILEL